MPQDVLEGLKAAADAETVAEQGEPETPEGVPMGTAATTTAENATVNADAGAASSSGQQSAETPEAAELAKKLAKLQEELRAAKGVPGDGQELGQPTTPTQGVSNKATGAATAAKASKKRPREVGGRGAVGREVYHSVRALSAAGCWGRHYEEPQPLRRIVRRGVLPRRWRGCSGGHL